MDVREKEDMKVETDSVEEFILTIKDISAKNKIYIWGAGTYGTTFGSFFNENKIRWSGYIDNCKELTEKRIQGKRVYQLEEIKEIDDVVVLISVSPVVHRIAYVEICEQLLNYGIKEEKIIRLSENLSMAQNIMLYEKKSEKYFQRLKELKGKFANKRCFVIGNGPSLRIEDLEKIANEISMGCNGLIQLFDKTIWKPTCYYLEDTNFIRKYVKNEEDLRNITDNCAFVFASVFNEIFDKYKDKYGNLYFFYTKRDLDHIQFEEDITTGMYTGGTSLYGIMQIAVYMGIEEIYLLGVDYTFRKEVYADGKVVENKNVNNHMNEIDQADNGLYYMDWIEQGWLCAKKYAEEHNIKIYNATRGGKLEIFERVNFDDLF